MALSTFFLSSLLLLPLIFTNICFLQAEEDCVYTMYIRTGSIIKAGTDSIISVTLYDDSGEFVEILDVEEWGGIMDPEHDYFERGNLDIFSGRAPCLSSPVCAMNLTSDGTGPRASWYCNYVEITSTGVHRPCTQQLFTVEQWLSVDVPPFDLTAIRNNCSCTLLKSLIL